MLMPSFLVMEFLCLKIHSKEHKDEKQQSQVPTQIMIGQRGGHARQTEGVSKPTIEAIGRGEEGMPLPAVVPGRH